MWLSKNLNPGKMAAIMTMLEQMVERRSGKEARGLTDDSSCRICTQHSETAKHLIDGCMKLAKSECLTRHNRALMIFSKAWAKQQELVGQKVIWYEQRWDRGTVLENNEVKLVWDFELHLRKTTTARRLDLILELKTDKKIWICDIECPQKNNIGAKRTEKLTKYRQLVFETREQHPGYEIYVIPVILVVLGSGIKALKVDLKKIFNNNELLEEVVAVMQKTVLIDSESILRRVMSGLIQGEDKE